MHARDLRPKHAKVLNLLCFSMLVVRRSVEWQYLRYTGVQKRADPRRHDQIPVSP